MAKPARGAENGLPFASINSSGSTNCYHATPRLIKVRRDPVPRRTSQADVARERAVDRPAVDGFRW